jgi:hypothetical protein
MRNSLFIALGVLAMSVAHAVPSPADIADPDSFGRNVVYLGVAGTPFIVFQTNCALSPPPLPARCITMNAQPALTSFTENKLATMTIPARSTHSMLCFALTPSIAFTFHNQTGVAQPTANFLVHSTITIENELLNDPALINLQTGLPFNGRINLPVFSYLESRSMAVNERDQKHFMPSRHCMEGLIARRALKDNFGLPTAIVDDFFNHDINLIFGAGGELRLVSAGAYYFGIRLYGDAP